VVLNNDVVSLFIYYFIALPWETTVREWLLFRFSPKRLCVDRNKVKFKNNAIYTVKTNQLSVNSLLDVSGELITSR